MKTLDRILIIIGCVTAILALAASVAAVLAFLTKQREDEELEQYLECAIQ